MAPFQEGQLIGAEAAHRKSCCEGFFRSGGLELFHAWDFHQDYLHKTRTHATFGLPILAQCVDVLPLAMVRWNHAFLTSGFPQMMQVLIPGNPL